MHLRGPLLPVNPVENMMVLIALLYYLQLPVIVVDPVVITRCVYILQVHNLLRCSLPLVPTSTHPFVCLSEQDTLFHEFAPQPSGLLGVFEKQNGAQRPGCVNPCQSATIFRRLWMARKIARNTS